MQSPEEHISASPTGGFLPVAKLLVLAACFFAFYAGSAVADPTVPGNDNRALAAPVPALPAQVTGNNVNATGEVGEPNHANVSAPSGGCLDVTEVTCRTSVWYSLTAARDGGVTLSTCDGGTTFDTALAVYTEDTATPPNLVLVAQNDDGPSPCAGGASALTFQATKGTKYWIAVAGKETATGSFVLHASDAPDTVFDSWPTDSSSATAAFTFHTASTRAPYDHFECALDGVKFLPCSAADATTGAGGVTFTGLCNETHALEVRSVDGNGGVDPTPASRSWTITGGPVTCTPPAASAAAVDQVTQNDAHFHGTVGTGGRGATYHFEYGVVGSTDPVSTTPDQAAASSGPVDAVVHGLAAGTTYHVRLVVSYAGPGSSTSDAPNFTTTPAPDTTITPISGMDAGFDFQTDRPTATHFDCSLDGAPAGTCSPASSGAGSASFSGLCGGNHTLEVRSVDDAGAADRTAASLTFSVPGGGACLPAGAQAAPADQVTQSGARLNGTVTTGGMGASYHFTYRPQSGSVPGARTPQRTATGAGAASETLTGLSPGTIYSFSLVVTGQGATTESTGTFTTASPAPVTTSSPSGTSSTTTTIVTTVIDRGGIGTARLLHSLQPDVARFARALDGRSPSALARRKSFSPTFMWLVPGTLTLTITVPASVARKAGVHVARARLLTIASGARQRHASGVGTVVTLLSVKGRALLRRVRKVQLTVTAVFTPWGGAPVAGQLPVGLRRR